MAIRIVIADDADLLLAGAQTVLSVVHRFSIVGLVWYTPAKMEAQWLS